MPVSTIILLGAFAGLTIYLGLPLVFLKRTSSSLKAFLSMLATGVLVFLFYDVIGKASEPINAAIDQVRSHQGGTGTFLLDVFLLVCGLGLGSVGLVYFNTVVVKYLRTVQARNRGAFHKGPDERLTLASIPVGVHVQEISAAEAGVEGLPSVPRTSHVEAASDAHELSAQTLALIIAIGIGLHNFSEGLAIGQSAVTGALQLAVVLIIGFGLHNMTEGFGIAGPLAGHSPSWKFIVLLGVIGGGPTFLGTIIGTLFTSPQLFLLFLALAAGAILYVIRELLGTAKRFKQPQLVMWGLLIGFLAGYATDLLVTFAGA
jgi:ZIP family zinc transporter